MKQPSRESPSLSKSTTRKGAGRFPQECGWFSPTLVELQRVFRRNFAKEIALRAGVDVTTVERWRSGDTAPGGLALARLLRSDVGDVVHDALIAGVQAPWAKNRRAVSEIARLRQQQADAARRLAALESKIGGGR